MSHLDRVFHPRSIAVIGASEVPGKAAERRIRSLIEGGYKGRIYLVNPKRNRIFSRKAYPSIRDIEEPVDLVMIVIPPPFVKQEVANSIEKGAGGIVIITAGLGEAGREGKQIEEEIVELASRSGTYIIGPNCSGIFSAGGSMNILGIPGIRPGSLSILAQSGNVIDSLAYYAKARGVGFSRIVSAGNAVGVKFHEYLSYLKEDPDTAVIMLYLEGVREGRAFIEAAREAARKKPVVAIKAGSTASGARATASHTGALALDDNIVDAAFRQAGIIRAYNVDELFDMADALASCPLPGGWNAVILSEGGGDNSIAADNLERHGVKLPLLKASTQDRIRPLLLRGMPASNPIDYGGRAEEDPEIIARCCRICMEDDDVHAVFVTGFFGGFKEVIAAHIAELEEKASMEITGLPGRYRKPLLVHSSFARDRIKALEILRASGIPVLESSERAARCLSALMRYAEVRRRLQEGDR